MLVLLAVPGWCEHYRFHHFGPEDGLTAAVSHVLQDRAGFLWVGTASGLFRYDGANFRQFGSEDGLPSGSIRALAESPDGALWVISARGLARFHHDAFEIIDTGAPPRELLSLGISPRGQIYVGAQRGLFAASAAGPLARPEFVPVAAAPAQPVEAIAATAEGTVWFGCGVRLCRLDQGRVATSNEAGGLPAGPWKAILRDRNGTLWLRGAEHLYVLLPGAGRFVARDRDLPPSTAAAAALAEDLEGRIWVSTDRGAARWTATGWRTIGPGQGLPAGQVTAIRPDRAGSLWIGLAAAGLLRWPQPFQWTSWTTEDGLPDSIVTAVLRQDAEHLWVGTARGLVRFGPGAATRTWKRGSGLAGDRVSALALGPDGAVWAACGPGGLSRIDPYGASVRSFGASAGLDDPALNALAFDPGGRLWIAADSAVFRSLAPGGTFRFERIKMPGSATPQRYSALAADRAGAIWVAAADGLLRCDDGSWTRYGVAEGLRDAPLGSLLHLQEGSLLAAYGEPLGLSRFSNSAEGWHAQSVSRASGLPSDDVRFLGRDALGQFWIGTDRGIASGVPGTWRIWSHEDGLLSPDAAPNSFFAAADGTVWLGTAGGLARFTPARRSTEQAPPAPVLTAARFGNHPRTPSGIATVAFTDNDFEACFSALNLSGRKDVLLRYRLWGWDERWIETLHPSVRYCNLPAGNYRFQVQSRFGNGPWSPPSAALEFRVLPAWYSTWWFAAILALAAAALFYGSLRWCAAHLRRERREPVPPAPPLRPAPLPAAVPAKPGPPPAALRVLLAEDNPVNQKLVRKAIEKMGHQIVVVGNGAEAVRIHSSGAFDLILMDLQMPEMDGFAAAGAIRDAENATAARTPIIALTAHAIQSDRDRCRAAGMDDFLSKPLDLNALADLMERLTRARSPLPPTPFERSRPEYLQIVEKRNIGT